MTKLSAVAVKKLFSAVNALNVLYMDDKGNLADILRGLPKGTEVCILSPKTFLDPVDYDLVCVSHEGKLYFQENHSFWDEVKDIPAVKVKQRIIPETDIDPKKFSLTQRGNPAIATITTMAGK